MRELKGMHGCIRNQTEAALNKCSGHMTLLLTKEKFRNFMDLCSKKKKILEQFNLAKYGDLSVTQSLLQVF